MEIRGVGGRFFIVVARKLIKYTLIWLTSQTITKTMIQIQDLVYKKNYSSLVFILMAIGGILVGNFLAKYPLTTVVFLGILIVMVYFILHPRRISVYYLSFFIVYCIVSGNLTFPTLFFIGSIGIYPHDFFIAGILSLNLFYFIRVIFFNVKYKLNIESFFIIAFLGYLIFLFLMPLLQKSGLHEGAGNETRFIILYSTFFTASFFLRDQKDCLSLLWVCFLGVMLYCIIYLSMYFWPGNPLRAFLPDYGYADYRLSYASKSIPTLFPFFLSAIFLQSKIINKKIVYLGFLLSLSYIFLSLSRATWLVLMFLVPLQIMFIKRKSIRFSFLKSLKKLFIIGFIISFLVHIPFLINNSYSVVLKDRFFSAIRVLNMNLDDILTSNDSTYSRWISYQLIWENIKESPIFGKGLGAFISRGQSFKFQHAFLNKVDSTYLVYWFKGGVIWLAIFIAMILSIMKKSYSNMKNANNEVELLLAVSIFFGLLNTVIIAGQDLILFYGLQINSIAVLFAIVVQWDEIFKENRKVTFVNTYLDGQSCQRYS
ncbi:MAG: O-antigen ligase family protein [bacterium]